MSELKLSPEPSPALVNLVMNLLDSLTPAARREVEAWVDNKFSTTSEKK